MAKTTSRRGGRKSRHAPGRTAKRAVTKKPAAGPTPKKRAASPDVQLAEAVRLFRKGDVKQTMRMMEAILNAHPDHWPTIKILWSMFWSLQHIDKALDIGQVALTRAANSPKTQEDLAIFFLGVARQTAIENPAAHPFLGPVIDSLSQFADDSRMSGQFQVVLQQAHLLANPAEALRTGMAGLNLFPRHAPAFHYYNSSALFTLGRHEDAVAEFGLKLAPFKGKTTRTKVARQYKALAADYDVNRLYQSYGPMMARLIVKTVGATQAKRILDAGCGTGSLGTHIRAAHLVGIDLSPEMLAKARERNVYQELIEGDLVATMAERTDRFDIVAATGVLYHIADLRPFFRQAARLLVPGGHLFFSTDPAPDSMDIGVSGPGEYAHSRAYVSRLAAETGFADIGVRIMPHRDNPGFWFTFRCEGKSGV